jgi:dTDP-4-amino-4,6-dideoxygalactose transaminase
LATDDDEVAARARRLRSHGMSSGSWSRFTGQSRDYDVEGLGFNYRLDEPRAALLLSRLARLEADIARRRELTRRYRSRLAAVDGLTVPYDDDGVGRSSCYVMPVLVADPARRDYVRTVLEDEHLVQTSIFYPALHELTAYRRRLGSQRLPATELVARTEITIPLYPHLDAPAQDRVIAALEDALAR